MTLFRAVNGPKQSVKRPLPTIVCDTYVYQIVMKSNREDGKK